MEERIYYDYDENKVKEVEKFGQKQGLILLKEYAENHPDRQIDCSNAKTLAGSYIDEDNDSVGVDIFISNISFKHKSHPFHYLSLSFSYSLRKSTKDDIIDKMKQYVDEVWDSFFKGTCKAYEEYLIRFDKYFENIGGS